MLWPTTASLSQIVLVYVLLGRWNLATDSTRAVLEIYHKMCNGAYTHAHWHGATRMRPTKAGCSQNEPDGHDIAREVRWSIQTHPMMAIIVSCL